MGKPERIVAETEADPPVAVRIVGPQEDIVAALGKREHAAVIDVTLKYGHILIEDFVASHPEFLASPRDLRIRWTLREGP